MKAAGKEKEEGEEGVSKRGVGKTAKVRTPAKTEVKSISGSGSKRGKEEQEAKTKVNFNF
jgi:hypothetical protein